MGLFVLTGSQQFGLLEGISQSLAGRVGLLHLLPFALAEVAAARPGFGLEDWLLNGFYPPLHDREIPPHVWFADYLATYVERDVRRMVQVRDLDVFHRFVLMCAARTGQLLNLSALAADCGMPISRAAIRRCMAGVRWDGRSMPVSVERRRPASANFQQPVVVAAMSGGLPSFGFANVIGGPEGMPKQTVYAVTY